jgi:hypothetical protein
LYTDSGVYRTPKLGRINRTVRIRHDKSACWFALGKENRRDYPGPDGIIGTQVQKFTGPRSGMGLGRINRITGIRQDRQD